MKVELGWTGEARYLLQGGRSAPGGGGGGSTRGQSRGPRALRPSRKGGGGNRGREQRRVAAAPGPDFPLPGPPGGPTRPRGSAADDRGIGPRREGGRLPFSQAGGVKTLPQNSFGNWVCLLQTKPAHSKAELLRAWKTETRKQSVRAHVIT